MSTREVLIYSHFERFWHWTQMALIFTMLVTGFAIHGLHDWISFDRAVTLHTLAALALLGLWVLATFWLFTTGNWKHYLPTARGLGQVVRFYSYGIFLGERHPYRKAFWRKHNPLQAIAYLALKGVLFPLIWASGIAYLLYFAWGDNPGAAAWLQWVALVHTATAYAILAFVVMHVYMLTIGGSFAHHVTPMLTGFDKVELSPEEEAYLIQDEPSHIR
ncbi:cytochrome b/b6 domain-containing protein [uncultured Thiodictyon sp.]|jgi:thiosulfate reductase cytochrome b subunit|uniref:cytochrome b/b6 domain-containing protein n=1 Tax=uncultured Thiodictyon sp. TaxID=1846217 RepID=UPI0025E01822|nr:cytochrome b/b6 domain-containing protein [uncultured Thiodictyon sp.]